MNNKRILISLISLWVILFILIPIGTMGLYSFWKVDQFKLVRTLTLANYIAFFTDPIYLQLLLKTLKLSVLIACLAVLISYPMALIVHYKGGAFKTVLFLGVLAPLWVGYLVRIYAWRSILGENGFINSVLMLAGVLEKPTTGLLFNNFSVIVTVLCIAIPFTFIPIYTTIEKIPVSLVRASEDLGGTAFYTFTHIVAPLSLPGIATGFMFAFITAVGDYMAPALVGGASGILFGNMIQTQFGNSFNWPLGASLAVILLLCLLLVILILRKLGDVKGTFEEN